MQAAFADGRRAGTVIREIIAGRRTPWAWHSGINQCKSPLAAVVTIVDNMVDSSR